MALGSLSKATRAVVRKLGSTSPGNELHRVDRAFVPSLKTNESRLENVARISPIIGMRPVGVVVVDEIDNGRLEVIQIAVAHVSGYLATHDTEPNLELIEPRTMARREQELNSMTGIGQELRSRFYSLKNPAKSLLAQGSCDFTSVGNIANQ